MNDRLSFDISAQPNSTTCGPTCLHAVYRYYGDDIPLREVIAETLELAGGGTMAVHLGLHALRRNYQASVYTYDLNIFDPTWFPATPDHLVDRLRRQLVYKTKEKFRLASEAFITFLQAGGRIRMEDVSSRLLRKYLTKRTPILAGLSATWLYGDRREISMGMVSDDIRGEPQGHFVVLVGYDVVKREVLVADPQMPNSIAAQHYYSIPLVHVVSAIMLGIVTYDANLLVIEPVTKQERIER
jgi:hypothetical protein